VTDSGVRRRFLLLHQSNDDRAVMHKTGSDPNQAFGLTPILVSV
jgi:hypothetical protein